MARQSIIRKHGKNINVSNDNNYIDNGDKKHSFKSWVGSASSDDDLYTGEQVDRKHKETIILDYTNDEQLINENNSNRKQCINYIDYLLYGGQKVKKPLFYTINKEELEIDYCDTAIVYFYNLHKKGMMSSIDYQKAKDELEARKLFARNKSKAYRLEEKEKKEREKEEKLKDKLKQHSCNSPQKKNHDNTIMLILSIVFAGFLLYFKII